MKTCKYILFFAIVFLFFFSNSIFCQAKVEEMKRKGVSFLQSGKLNEAFNQFNKYISAKPQAGDGYNFRGICYEKKLQYQNAVTDYHTAVNLEPTDKEYRKNF